MVRADLEKTLRASIRASCDLGWIIRQGSTYFPKTKECCVLGAYAVANSVSDIKESIALTQCGAMLGLTNKESGELASGFDDMGVYSSSDLSVMGARLWEYAESIRTARHIQAPWSEPSEASD